MSDTTSLLSRLRAIDEEQMYAFPHLCEQAVKEAIFKIECLEGRVAEFDKWRGLVFIEKDGSIREPTTRDT